VPGANVRPDAIDPPPPHGDPGVSVAGLRSVGSGVAAAGLLAGLAMAGRELPTVALACALLAIAAQPRWYPRQDVPAALVAIAWVVSAQLAPLPATAMPTLTCVLVVCGAARLPAGIARALFAGCLAMAVLILALVSAFELAKMGEPRSTSYPGLDGWGGFPEMGLLGVMAVPMALSLALGGGPWEARAGAVVATLSTAAGVALSASRAAWGAALVGMVLVLVGRRRGRWPAVAAAIAGVALLATLVVAAWLRPMGPGGEVSLDMASRSRLAAWGEAARLWQERPLVGWGPASYRQVYARHYERPADAQFHAHNAYLHVAVETGVLGVATALWFAVAVIAGRGGGSAARGTMVAAARIGLVCGLLAVAVRFLVDYFDPTGAGMRVLLWLSVLAGLRLALEDAPDRLST
jgi:O-antigen ligase